MPQNSLKKVFFGLFWTISSTKMGLLILLRTYFQAKTLGQTSCPNKLKKEHKGPQVGGMYGPMS
jgi:hypothetical protein